MSEVLTLLAGVAVIIVSTGIAVMNSDPCAFAAIFGF